jgi:hypothetical protein
MHMVQMLPQLFAPARAHETRGRINPRIIHWLASCRQEIVGRLTNVLSLEPQHYRSWWTFSFVRFSLIINKRSTIYIEEHDEKRERETHTTRTLLGPSQLRHIDHGFLNSDRYGKHGLLGLRKGLGTRERCCDLVERKARDVMCLSGIMIMHAGFFYNKIKYNVLYS